MAETDLSGMTVNERLFALGTLDDFNAACARSDLATLRQLLELAEVDESSIALTLARASAPDPA